MAKCDSVHYLSLQSDKDNTSDSETNHMVALSDLQGPLALEALSQQQQQQAARLGQWGEAAGPFLQGSVAFPLPQQLAHLAQPGMARFPHQLLRAASWGLSANMEDEAVNSASSGPPFTRLVCILWHANEMLKFTAEHENIFVLSSSTIVLPKQFPFPCCCFQRDTTIK